MKYEQKIQVETQEYICLVKRIDGVVAQKNLVSELIRCKDCKYYDGKWCKLHAISDFDLNDVMKSADDFCSYAERKEE